MDLLDNEPINSLEEIALRLVFVDLVVEPVLLGHLAEPGESACIDRADSRVGAGGVWAVHLEELTIRKARSSSIDGCLPQVRTSVSSERPTQRSATTLLIDCAMTIGRNPININIKTPAKLSFIWKYMLTLFLRHLEDGRSVHLFARMPA